tara:strand:+ start:1032 stop:1751 length:720 start_codon:yes stop_codon:yes gene_type:complete
MNYENIYKLINSVNIKNSYCILEAILRIIDIDLYNSPKYDIKSNVNVFSKKLANDLIQKKLYTDFPNILRFEKNNIYSKLINNEECDENIYKYISIYLELNIIILKDSKYRFVGSYNSSISSIFLVETSINIFAPIYLVEKDKIYNIFKDPDVIKILDYFSSDNKLVFNNKKELTNKELKQINRLKNYTLSKLQEICEIYSIDIYKYISDRKLYKKKTDLFEELKLYLINDNDNSNNTK